MLARQYFRQQSTSGQLYAHQDSRSQGPQALAKNRPGESLTIEAITGFASRSGPVNQQSLQKAQEYVALERNASGLITTSQIAQTLPKGIYVQTASLRSVEDATRLRQSLQAKGFSPFIQEAFVKRQFWYRVRLGPFPNMASAEQAARQLRSQKYTAQVLNTQ